MVSGAYQVMAAGLLFMAAMAGTAGRPRVKGDAECLDERGPESVWERIKELWPGRGYGPAAAARRRGPGPWLR